MYLSKFRLFNYKSFRDSGLLEFKPGINIIVGANNSGKTALLEALSLNFKSNIHKSITTFPLPSDVINSYSGYQLSLTVEKEKIKPILKKLSPDNNVLIAVPDIFKNHPEFLEESLDGFFNDGNIQDIEIQIRFRGSNPILFDNIPSFFSSSYNEPEENWLKTDSAPSSRTYYGIYINHGMNIDPGHFGETIQYQIFQRYRNTIYRFDAERLNIRSCPVGMCRELNSNASNLAEVLSNLQANFARFKRFNEYVSTVIPGIKWVSVIPSENNTVEINIWTLDPETGREDLAFPLSDCGTGVSQVLAILYVVITSQEPRMIIIDEPQSFLHPGAAKKLIEILKEFPQHQYFIATHSPALITAANPSTIVKLRHEEGETQALVMKSEDLKEESTLLAELGVSLSDVFGADSILWVEGPTEELCFPLILSKLAPKLLTGTKIISIKNTSDLLGKKAHFADVMFDLYKRLSGGNNLYPPAIGFVFDRECLSEREIADLKRMKPHRIEFIKRRMYENYLLHPDAIAFVLNQEDAGREQPLTSQEVREGLETNKLDKSFFSETPTKEQLLDTQWVGEKIDAAKAINALFNKFSEARVEFKKTRHSRMLTEWLLENNPEHFDELVQFLQSILG